MGEVDYRKWANNWDPVIDVQKVKPKVDTNYQKALELSKKKEQKPTKKKRNALSARPRETYFDLEQRHNNRKLPPRDGVLKSTFYATNRYKQVPDRLKTQLREEWKHQSNIEMLKEKIELKEKQNYRHRLKQRLDEYASMVKTMNSEKVEEMRKEGKHAGYYTAKKVAYQQKLKSKENNMERSNRRKLREQRKQEQFKLIDEADRPLLQKLAQAKIKKKEANKQEVERNKDLRF